MEEDKKEDGSIEGGGAGMALGAIVLLIIGLILFAFGIAIGSGGMEVQTPKTDTMLGLSITGVILVLLASGLFYFAGRPKRGW